MSKKKRNAVKTACGQAGLVLAATLAADAGAADRQLNFAPLSIARGETARFNMGGPPEPERPERIDPVACKGTLALRDANGAPLLGRDGRPLTRELSVLPGQTASVVLPAAVVFGDGSGLRALLSASFRMGGPPAPEMPDPCTNLSTTLEIYDSVTGRTNAVLGGPPEPEMPAPDGGTLPQ